MSDLNDNLRLLKESQLFREMPQSELEQLYVISTHIEVKANERFIQEGDPVDCVFIILQGEVNILKYEPTENREFVIATLGAGASVGEMAILDHGNRSGSAEAIVDSRLLSVPLKPLDQLIEKSSEFQKLYRKLAQKVSERLRYTNEVTVKALSEKLHELRLRNSMAQLFINIIVMLCAFSYALLSLINLTKLAPNSSYITLPMMVAMLGAVCWVIYIAKLDLKDLGLTTHNWRKAIYEAIVFTIPLLILIVVLKWILIHYVPKFSSNPLFQLPYELKVKGFSLQLNLVIPLIYIFFISPVQEFMARGVFQGPLQTFLDEKNPPWKSIIVSNLIFSTFHLFMSLPIALMTFIPGVYLGWLYSRHKTLIGVSIAHAILGLWFLVFVGFLHLFQ